MPTERDLIRVALKAIHDPSFEGEPGYCQGFVRQCVQAAFGDKYDDSMLASATLSGRSLQSKGYTVENRTAVQPGDILYKYERAGRWGHVGIYVGPQEVNDTTLLYLKGLPRDWYSLPLVVENSSTQVGRLDGAKGCRHLNAGNYGYWGDWDATIRLPEGLHPMWTIKFPDGNKVQGEEQDSRVYVQVRRFARALGLPVDFNALTGVTRMGKNVLDTTKGVWRNDEQLYPVTYLCGLVQLNVSASGSSREVIVTR